MPNMTNSSTAGGSLLPLLPNTTSPWTTYTIYTILTLSSLLIIRSLFLPKPIPGIPYNPDSARRILGDIPELAQKVGRRQFFASQFVKLNSPIYQLFLSPFLKPAVLVADYREQVDVCLRRTREFDRTWLAKDTFGSIIPEHHITMKTKDPRFKGNKQLIKDLMTPAFLHEVSAPEIYAKTLALVRLWGLKTKLAAGRPFAAGQDVWAGALDVIMGVAFGLDDVQSATHSTLAKIEKFSAARKEEEDREDGDSEDEAFPFPEAKIPAEYSCLIVMCNSLGLMFKSAMPRIRHWIYRQTNEWKQAAAARESLTRREITKAIERMDSYETSTNGEKMRARNAMDSMLIREKEIAAKAGKEPNYFSQTIYDELLGYLVGGHDTSSTTLQWGLKYLTIEQEAQKHLRSSMREMLSQAAAERRNPTVTELIKTSLPVLDATVEETLRLARTLPVIIREALVDTTILGVPIKKGTNIFFNTHAASIVTPACRIDESQRTEGCRKARDRREDWDPDTIGKFSPSRWLKTETTVDEKTGREDEKLVYDSTAGPNLAFGAGPRGCFGRRLAYLELRILTALLVWNFEFLELPDKLNSWDTEEQLTTHPVDCFVRIRRAEW